MAAMWARNWSACTWKACSQVGLSPPQELASPEGGGLSGVSQAPGVKTFELEGGLDTDEATRPDAQSRGSHGDRAPGTYFVPGVVPCALPV